MATLVWLLGYLLVQLPMYLLYRKTMNNVRQLAENRFMTISSPDVPQEEMGEMVAVVTLSNLRKKLITGLMMIFVVWAFLISWGAGWGPQPDKVEWEADWPGLVLFVGLGYFFGGVVPWLGAIFYSGEFRVVTRNGILKVSSLTKTFFVRWDQIDFVEVREGRAASWWIIVRTKKGSFSVWSDCRNLDVLIEGIVNNVPMDVWRALAQERKIGIRNGQV